MRPEPRNSITRLLIESRAKKGDIWGDEFGNRWVVHPDRDGYRLEGYGMMESNAWIPYWTCFVIALPGFRPTGKSVSVKKT